MKSWRLLASCGSRVALRRAAEEGLSVALPKVFRAEVVAPAAAQALAIARDGAIALAREFCPSETAIVNFAVIDENDDVWTGGENVVVAPVVPSCRRSRRHRWRRASVRSYGDGVIAVDRCGCGCVRTKDTWARAQVEHTTVSYTWEGA